MPELPEVETTKRGIEPFLLGKKIQNIQIFQPRLRYPISDHFTKHLINQRVTSIDRRAKYLLIHTESRKIILHLGMSGSLRIELSSIERRKHDHVIFEFQNDDAQSDAVFLYFHDPRRFGFIQEYPQSITPEFLIKLAPEPLSDSFDTDYLFNILKKRKKAIKVAIMDQNLVVGVGNIYASEALFMAGIHPETLSSDLTINQISNLVIMIKRVLNAAILQGGTTLKDFVNPSGNPGYFAQTLNVYGKQQKPCNVCQTPIQRQILGQRATYWCPHCQMLTLKS